mgnify:CR=1 FL=1|jgi:hypothetical protein|tara:strand:- start:791 stop:1582 length:792 start_codon:yes stop_codon:yes gene_type:complete
MSKIEFLGKDELIQKVMMKKEFSELLKKDVELVFEKFDKDEFSDEEKVKLTRKTLRNIFSGFGGRKILSWSDKDANEILKKHLSTKERHGKYNEIYSRILKGLPKKIGVVDLGCGVNGFSYNYFKELNFNVNYLGAEAVGQFVNSTNSFFKKEKINGVVYHESILDSEKIKKIILKTKTPRVVFLFKVVDALESFEKNYTKELLKEIVPFSDRIIISFPTESWSKRKKFFAKRKWLTDFIKENWNILDDFEISGERYLVFEKG